VSNVSLTWSAYSIDVRDPSFWARADHGPHRYSVENVAARVLQAGFDNWAGIDALLPNAHQLVRAIDVDSALRFLDLVRGMSFAVRERISQRYILGTAAGRHVILHIADRVLCAG